MKKPKPMIFGSGSVVGNVGRILQDQDYPEVVVFFKTQTGPEIPELPCRGVHIKATGVVVSLPNGKILIRRVANDYAGYIYSFAKGRIESNLTFQQNAHKEAYEELGILVKITHHLADAPGQTGCTRFYRAEPVEGSTADHGGETSWVEAVTLEEARAKLNQERDRKVLKAEVEWRKTNVST